MFYGIIGFNGVRGFVEKLSKSKHNNIFEKKVETSHASLSILHDNNMK
jgi:hypothetical protein